MNVSGTTATIPNSEPLQASTCNHTTIEVETWSFCPNCNLHFCPDCTCPCLPTPNPGPWKLLVDNILGWNIADHIGRAIVVQDFFGEVLCSSGDEILTSLMVCAEPETPHSLHQEAQHVAARTRHIQRFAVEIGSRAAEIVVMPIRERGRTFTLSTAVFTAGLFLAHSQPC